MSVKRDVGVVVETPASREKVGKTGVDEKLGGEEIEEKTDAVADRPGLALPLPS